MQRGVLDEAVDTAGNVLRARVPVLAGKSEFENSVAVLKKLFESEKEEVEENGKRVEIAGKRAKGGDLDFLGEFKTKMTQFEGKNQFENRKTEISDGILADFHQKTDNFTEEFPKTAKSALLHIDQQIKTVQKSLSDSIHSEIFDLQSKIVEIQSKTAFLRTELKSARVQTSVQPLEESLSQYRTDKPELFLRDFRREIEEYRSAEPMADLSPLEGRISALESQLCVKSQGKTAVLTALSALHSRISALETKSDPITDDSDVDLSVGVTDQSISIYPERQASNSDVMLISLNEVGDSDLESQGYVSPHLSPMNALMSAVGMKGTGKFSFQQEEEPGNGRGETVDSDPSPLHLKPPPQKPSLKIPEPRISEESPVSDLSASASNPHLSSSAEFGDEDISLP